MTKKRDWEGQIGMGSEDHRTGKSWDHRPWLSSFAVIDSELFVQGDNQMNVNANVDVVCKGIVDLASDLLPLTNGFITNVSMQ